MEIIHKNPFRIAGVLSNDNARIIEKRKGKVRAFAEVGKEIESEYDFQFLDKISRSEIRYINKAFSNIEQNEDRLNFALFWFLSVSHVDNTALEYLKNGDDQKAIEIWEKVTWNKEVNSKNFSSFNNIGTYKLLSKTQLDVKEGIEAKLKLLESNYFNSFISCVADETFSVDSQKQSERMIDELIAHLKNQYSSSETLQLFNGCNTIIKNYLTRRLTEEPIHNMESQIERSKERRRDNKSGSYEFGLNLYAETKDDLALLKSLLHADDLKYKTIADLLASEVMQCGIDYFNESQENDSKLNYLESAQELTKIADDIGVGSLVKDRVKDSIASLEEMKDKGVLQAINLLKSVKEAFYTNGAKIFQQVKELEEKDIEIKLGYKSINYAAVEENVRNSIDWKKVNSLLDAVCGENNLKQIKASSNAQLKAEFLELANWLKENSLINSTVVGIIKKYRAIAPKLHFTISTSQITTDDNNPLYTKFVRHIRLTLNVRVLKNTSVNFYLKYINPSGEINRNSKISPDGYTSNDLRLLDENSNNVVFSGWGNANKCTFSIGEHRIEVYVDEYMIHSKTFIIDLAPSEKIEMRIREAEKEIQRINQKNYFSSEIKAARNEMKGILSFKLFRASSERKKQIEFQQKKINLTMEKSRSQKKSNIKIQEEQINKLRIELSEAKY